MPTHYDGSPEEVLALDTYIKFSRAVDSFTARVMAHGALESLTMSQFGVLEVLYHLGPMCQGAISQKLLKSTGNMTLVIDNLEKHDLVRRVRSSEDRRMITIELTPAGREMIERVFPAHAAHIREEMSVLTPAEQAELGRLCRKLGLGEDCPMQKDEEARAG
jgi:MarR family transcriptional regulator, 2-MHQ and catechol-resistance regulon repressor